MIKAMKIASELNQLTLKELQIVSQFITQSTGEMIVNFVSAELQDRDLREIEVQEPAC